MKKPSPAQQAELNAILADMAAPTHKPAKIDAVIRNLLALNEARAAGHVSIAAISRINWRDSKSRRQVNHALEMQAQTQAQRSRAQAEMAAYRVMIDRERKEAK